MKYKHWTITTHRANVGFLAVLVDPQGLYEFGPFDSAEEAADSVDRHAPDLASEGWQIVGQKLLQQECLFGHTVSQAGVV
ncbi:DUF1816 domain-containing protein [Gloeobacter violaceus]|uniref:DUF1816 domain-containing protein n=1 Tax=Gloeobacter violaceus TaxID=33072 RepID=UPI0013E8D51D|nr:DUF1816 domain-containing protein [Gloeobacter violaceus]